LAEGLGDRLVVVFGYDPPGPLGGEMSDHREAVKEFGQKVIQEALEKSNSRNVESDFELVPRKAAEALVTVASDRDAWLIVIGSHRETPVAGAILGSVPYKLLHISEVPVLVVPTP
jgi:nucleotide-binding universal stress UspA family protein